MNAIKLGYEDLMEEFDAIVQAMTYARCIEQSLPSSVVEGLVDRFKQMKPLDDDDLYLLDSNIFFTFEADQAYDTWQQDERLQDWYIPNADKYQMTFELQVIQEQEALLQ